MGNVVIQNGSPTVIDWAAKYFDKQLLPCLHDTWHVDQMQWATLQEKLRYLIDQNACTSIMSSEGPLAHELFQLPGLKIVKVISSHARDVQCLDPSWSIDHYDHSQWLKNCFFGLCAADSIVFLDPVQSNHMALDDDATALVFTPARCGTHVLKGILGIDEHLHHHPDFLSSLSFQKLLRSTIIYSILRRSFHEQALSDAIGRQRGILVTTSDNLESMRQKIQSWDPICFGESDAEFTWQKIVNFVDILLGIKIMFGKNIQFYLLEDLQPYFSQANTLPNPYNKTQLIANYEQSVEICRDYQMAYDRCLKNLITALNLQVYLP